MDNEIEERTITPQTRRMIVWALTGIAAVCIIAEVALLAFGFSTSEALLTIAATAIGGVAGMAVPGAD